MENIEKARVSKHQPGESLPDKPWVKWLQGENGTWGFYSTRQKKYNPDTFKIDNNGTAGGSGSDNSSTTKTAKQSDDTTTDNKEKREEKDNIEVQVEETEEEYGAPQRKVDYKEVPDFDTYKVPKSVSVPDSRGAQKRYTREKMREWISKKDDNKLIDFINNPDAHEELRHLAVEEAMGRGIDRNKLDFGGGLKTMWDKAIKSKKIKDNHQDVSVDDLDDDFGTIRAKSTSSGSDVEWGMKVFDNGENDSWLDPDNKEIVKRFNLDTPKGRHAYDMFKDAMKRLDPDYQNPNETMQDLQKSVYGFLTSNSPLFVSSGGAAAGKTYTIMQEIDRLGLKEFDPENPDDDYDFFMVSNPDLEEKELRKILEKHNGKLLIFDDNDKLLTTNSSPLKAIMKAVNDNKLTNRRFQDSKGNPVIWRGQMIFTTNKTGRTLNKNEDAKAVMSRAKTHDIQLSINENLELLKDRYKTMGGRYFVDKFDKPILPKSDEDDVRQKVYDYFIDNKNDLDPQNFTIRTFNKVMEALVDDYKWKLQHSKNAALPVNNAKFETIVKNAMKKSKIDELSSYLDSIQILTKAKTEDDLVIGFSRIIGDMDLNEAEKILS